MLGLRSSRTLWPFIDGIGWDGAGDHDVRVDMVLWGDATRRSLDRMEDVSGKSWPTISRSASGRSRRSLICSLGC